jgi:excisionase family DNA binding protein
MDDAMSEQERRVYTVDEVAALLGISRNSAYAAIKAGELPSITLGRRVLIPRVPLDKMLEGNNR